MRVPLGWLREYVDIPWEAEELAERLTMSGVKVEGLECLGEDLRGLVVAQITAISRHLAADGLWVVEVMDGESRRQVVTGAPGLEVGQKVAYARPGSVLPGGWQIGRQEFRGQVSEGMLLSATELVSGEEHRENEGILVLPRRTAPGTDLVAYFGLRDTVLDLELTVNYAVHCQSILGVAREVAALTGGKVRPPRHYQERYQPSLAAGREAWGEAAHLTSVEVEAPDLCPRYTAILLREVKPLFSPVPIQFRLHAVGMRPLSAVVDATNYVMYEVGQPLHAFDLKRLEEERIVVRRAWRGERLRTLDGQMRELSDDMLVIAGAGHAVGLAGVMGGEETEVTSATTDILLEAAWFDPSSVRRTSRRLGLRTEAAARFEKGIDPAGVLAASYRAARLLEEVGAARLVPGAVDVRSCDYGPRHIPLRPDRVRAVLGIDVSSSDIRGYLERLRCQVEPGTEAEGESQSVWQVTVPTDRGDVVGEIDLVEEVARMYGYDRIPSTLPAASPTVGRLTPEQQLIEDARRALAAAGLDEALTFSLLDPAAFDRLRLSPEDGRRRALTVRNPLSVEWSVLRTTLIPGLLLCLRHNQSHQVARAGLFELAAVYLPRELPSRELPDERLHVAAAAYGPWYERHFREPSPQTDYLWMKGVAEYLLAFLGAGNPEFVLSAEPYLHPGRQARVLVGRHDLGFVGELHPQVAREHELEGRVAVMEFDFTTLLQLADRGRRFQPLPRFPSVVRDVAFLLPEHVAAARAEEVMRTNAGDWLESLVLFDVYQGEGIPPGQRSLAYSLTYRSPDKTLTDREVDDRHAKVREALERELGAALR